MAGESSWSARGTVIEMMLLWVIEDLWIIDRMTSCVIYETKSEILKCATPLLPTHCLNTEIN